MEQLIEAIHAAVAPDASDEAKAAGVSACRSILAALEPSSSPPPAPAPPPLDANIAVLATAIRGLPIDQLLDLAIAKLRAALPATSEAPQVQRLNIPLIRVPRP